MRPLVSFSYETFDIEKVFSLGLLSMIKYWSDPTNMGLVKVIGVLIS